MAQAPPADVSVLLFKVLEKLTRDDFEGFKWHLEKFTEIPVSKLETADRRRTADLLVQHFPQQPEHVMREFLVSIKRDDLALRLPQNNAGDSQR